VSRLKIVALKSHNHFRAFFEPIAAEIIRSDPPGWATSNLENLNYQLIRRPVWPLDDGVVWPG
jgi:microcystin degradation protein MlrC